MILIIILVICIFYTISIAVIIYMFSFQKLMMTKFSASHHTSLLLLSIIISCHPIHREV